MIKKSNLTALIDITALISFVFVVSTGVLMRYVLPPRSGHSVEVLGMSRHEWGNVHFYITFTFLVILSIHLILHWRFFFRLFQEGVKSDNVYRIVLGVIALIAVLALAAAPFVAPIEHSDLSKGSKFGKHRR